jgi:hypothetical protein
MNRFEGGGDDADLTQAISGYREIVATAPRGSVEAALAAASLGRALFDERDPDAARQASEHLSGALALLPADHPARLSIERLYARALAVSLADP